MATLARTRPPRRSRRVRRRSPVPRRVHRWAWPHGSRAAVIADLEAAAAGHADIARYRAAVERTRGPFGRLVGRRSLAGRHRIAGLRLRRPHRGVPARRSRGALRRGRLLVDGAAVRARRARHPRAHRAARRARRRDHAPTPASWRSRSCSRRPGEVADAAAIAAAARPARRAHVLRHDPGGRLAAGRCRAASTPPSAMPTSGCAHRAAWRSSASAGTRADRAADPRRLVRRCGPVGVLLRRRRCWPRTRGATTSPPRGRRSWARSPRSSSSQASTPRRCSGTPPGWRRRSEPAGPRRARARERDRDVGRPGRTRPRPARARGHHRIRARGAGARRVPRVQRRRGRRADALAPWGADVASRSTSRIADLRILGGRPRGASARRPA